MIIPKEKLTHFQRWEVGSFDHKPVKPAPARIEPPTTPPPAPVVEPSIALPTAEEIERIHDEARRAGYEVGLAEGRTAGEAAGRESLAAQATQFAALTENLQQALLAADQNIAEQLLAVALEVAAQVTRSALKVNPELLLPVIREAITSLPLHHAHIVLRLNGADIGLVREQLGEQFAQTGTQLIEDNNVTPGGCLLQAGASEVDASIETRWKRVLEAIGVEPQAWLTP